MHYFKQDVTEYIEKLEGVLEECQLKENFDLLSQRFFDIPLSGGKELKGALIQHAIFNSIVENYVPKDIDIIKEQLCYFGDFSKSSLKDILLKFIIVSEIILVSYLMIKMKMVVKSSICSVI